VPCEYYALEGLTICSARSGSCNKAQSSLQIEGVLLTMYDNRLNLSQNSDGRDPAVFSPSVSNHTIIHETFD